MNEQRSMEELYPILKETVESGGEFRLFPKGTSMMPLLRQGIDSVVLIKPAKLCKYDICLFRRANGEFVLHRLVKKSGVKLIFCGDNQRVKEGNINESAVIAVATAVYRGEKRISCNSFCEKRYVFFHCTPFFRFVRFSLRKMRRLLSFK